MAEFPQAWLCRQIVGESRDAVICADREGIIRLWNTGAAEMFGYGPAEALGRPLDLIIPENLRARHNEGYRRVMAAGVSKYAKDLLAVPGLTRDGRRISLEFTISLVRDEAGKSWAPRPSSGTSRPAGSGSRSRRSGWRPWRRK
jgi:PAS domain S-box-containing protein